MNNNTDFYSLTFQQYGLPEPEKEYRFDFVRKWRFDYSWPAVRLAVELEGGIHRGGRHVRGTGYAADMEKYNAAAQAGWVVLRYQPGSRSINYQQVVDVYDRLKLENTAAE